VRADLNISPNYKKLSQEQQYNPVRKAVHTTSFLYDLFTSELLFAKNDEMRNPLVYVLRSDS